MIQYSEPKCKHFFNFFKFYFFFIAKTDKINEIQPPKIGKKEGNVGIIAEINPQKPPIPAAESHIPECTLPRECANNATANGIAIPGV